MKISSATVLSQFVDLGENISDYGHCWAITSQPIIENSKTSLGIPVHEGEFTSELSDLVDGTTFYVRAYAITRDVTYYSNEISFTFKSFTPSIGKNFGGGIIFYIDNSGSSGLICSTVDQSTDARWGCSGLIKGITFTSIGMGYQNTLRIVQGCQTITNAASISMDFGFNGYNDWFLPSKDELALMYTNLKLNGMGSFSMSEYWSSSEANSGAWIQSFVDGYQYPRETGSRARVRAVRTF